MSFVPWFVLLAALAMLFVAWPLLRNKRQSSGENFGDDLQQRVAFNDALHAEQLDELRQQLAVGEITQGQYDKLKKEADALHEQDNAIDARTSSQGRFGRPVWLIAVLAIAVPAIASVLYNNWGAADDWQIQQLNTELFRLQQRRADPSEIQPVAKALYDRLQERVEEEPDNLNNRFLLARTAVELGEFRSALEAYRYILERQPKSPQVVGEMAQVLFMAAGNRFTPEVQQVFDRALQMDPENTELLGFAGIGAYQSGKFQLAIDYWQRGMRFLQPGDPRHQTWQQAIAEAQRQLAAAPGGSAAGENTTPAEGNAAESAASSPLRVSVSLGEEVQAAPEDTVFVYARAWQGPRMPLAMQQVTVADLPVTVELDDSMSMVPGMTMSRFPQLELVARISSSGQAEARPGDWQAVTGPVDSADAEQPLELVIDSQLR